MGYMQGSQTRSKYKNTDSAQNHVDRVRVPDPNCQFGGPGRGSGWRHRSLSNIDLTSQSKHSFTKQTKGYTSSLYDLYSRLEAKRDKDELENLYGNSNINSADKVESIYDRIEQTLDTINKSETCSLRRTRSLAVIREETFNDLQIGGGIRSRRSQLIPRAKLLNRSFFQNRNSNNGGATNNNNSSGHITRKKYRGEEDSGSGVDTQTSETRESDDYCGNLKKLQAAQLLQKGGSGGGGNGGGGGGGDEKLLSALWINDKSDLDSLDSDYFKNSLHQLDGSGIYSAYDGIGGGNHHHKDPYTGRIIGTPDISIANGCYIDRCSLRSDGHEESPLPDYCTIKTDEVYANDKFVSAEDVSVIHVNGGGGGSSSSGGGGGGGRVDSNTYKATRSGSFICDDEKCRGSSGGENRRISNCIGVDDTDANRKPKFKEDHKSVISYDSIYLSSEGSNEAATIIEEEEEKINEYLSDNNYSTLSEYMNTKNETKSTVSVANNHNGNNSNNSNSNNNNVNNTNDDGDNLYSQINKLPSPKTTSESETKTKLTTFSDISNRGTLERLTFISSGGPLTHNSENNKKAERSAATANVPPSSSDPAAAAVAAAAAAGGGAAENQYCSLPLANISKSLQASERIDAKLRLTCYPLEEQSKIYDSITNFGRAHKKLRQRESYEPAPPLNLIANSLSSDGTKAKETTVLIKPPQTRSPEVIISETFIVSNSKSPSSPSPAPTPSPAPAPNASIYQHIVDESNNLVRIDEESVSLLLSSAAELNEVETLRSSKNRDLDEIREKPKNILLPASAAHRAKQSASVAFDCRSPDIQISRDNNIEETVDVPTCVKVNRSSSGGGGGGGGGAHKSYQKSHYSKRQHCGGGRNSERYGDNRDRLNANLKVNLSNTLKRRLESKARHNLNEKLSRNNFDKSHKSHHSKHRVQQAIIENIKTHIVQPNFNMSRPQIMHVIDSKRNLPKSALKNSKQNKENEMINVNTTVTGQAKHEMLRKVDSVRNYWSRLIETVDADIDDNSDYMAGDERVATLMDNFGSNLMLSSAAMAAATTSTTTTAAAMAPTTTCIGSGMSLNSTLNRIIDGSGKLPKAGDEMICKPPTISVSNNTLKRAASAASGLHSLLYTERDELNSYTPSVELVELDDQKQAAIVKIQGVDAEDFDHVRYKVMKTDTFQKNILTKTRKEPPLDGLLQYLNDYRFQELLTQNNVVIIEPVRTKIEPISNKSHDSQLLTCKITAGAGKSSDGSGKGGLRKHFFYHPIRVNKELLDEELPTPDTVRNAKKLFEETLLLCPMKAQKSRSMIGLNETCKSIDRKYLTLETFNNAAAAAVAAAAAAAGKNASKHGLNGNSVYTGSAANACNRIKKWDSASLSSGISSGDLSSPCDCNDTDDPKFGSHENANDLCESYYVSQDILEKIRECGSSVTYYGGRVLNNQSPEVSPMTKAIMREIHSDNNICEVCHPNGAAAAAAAAVAAKKLYTTFCDADKNHLGMKLRLIKSNSCNSRLELAGTRFNDGPLHKFCTKHRSNSHNEDTTVRNIIHRIETNAIQDKRVPRIIESKCIEKLASYDTTGTSAAAAASTTNAKHNKPFLHSSFRKDGVELDRLSKSAERLGPIEILSQVNVKNHINAISMKVNNGGGMSNNNSNSNSNSSINSVTGGGKMNREVLMPRNKDVDLAIQLKEMDKIKSMAGGRDGDRTISGANGGTCGGGSSNIESRSSKSGPITATIRPTSMLTKAELEERKLKENHKAILEDLCKTVNAKTEEEKCKKNSLIKWDSLEKNYFANDVALKRKPKYDDIEFEEFEVIEPKNK